MDIIEICAFFQPIGTDKQHFPANCSKIGSRTFDVALYEYLEGRTEDESTGRHFFEKNKWRCSDMSTASVLNIFRYVEFLTNLKGK
jgi:hypothetical protein